MILLVAVSTAQQPNDQCSICGAGVSIESYNYTTQFHNLDDNTTRDVLINGYTCFKVEKDATSGSFYNTTCYIIQQAAQTTLDCNCGQFDPPTAIQNPPTAPSPQDPSTAPTTAPPATSTAAVGAFLGYSMAGVVFVATASGLA
jgi:hypothetical protein